MHVSAFRVGYEGPKLKKTWLGRWC
ncbi:hypothetical protein HYPGJ_20307 [Hyphomicrobium sp. GJ21]|nr:hypothetical protein HYPGJ_20307 [Hyphomicrobium sp. GJ21]